MGLESGSFVDDLVTSNPTGTDAKSQGDDHLRLIKTVLKTTLPNATKAFRFPTVLAKTANYTVAAGDDNALITMDATGGARSINLLAAATAGAGFLLQVVKIDSSANAVTIDPNGAETINGAATLVLTAQYDGAIIFCNGSEWYALATPVSAGVPSTRDLIAGSGLTGGGDLSADRTFNVGAGIGITVNANDVAVDESAIQGVKQVVSTIDSAYQSGTTVAVFDDTIMQSTEGIEVFTQSITPGDAANILIFDIVVNFEVANTSAVVLGLFKDSAADAVASIGVNPGGNTFSHQAILHHQETAGGTSAQTWKVRIGSTSAGTIEMNGQGGVRKLGGKFSSGIRITEVQP